MLSTDILSTDILSNAILSTDIARNERSPDPFAMEADESQVPVRELAKQPMWINAILTVAVWLTACLPALLELPLWLHATWLGTTFGLVSVTSARLTWRVGRIASTIVWAVLLPLEHQSLMIMTWLEPYSAWFVVLAIAAGGWLIGWLQKPSLDSNYRHKQRGICSLWDLVCLMTFTALLTHVIPRVEHPLDLACQMAPCIVGGWTISLLAFEWAWRDRWTLGSFMLALMIAPAACLLSLTVRPGEMSLSSAALWLLAGPASVLAMQGIVTLGYAAWYRFAPRLLAALR